MCPKTHKVWAIAGMDTTDVDPRMAGNFKIVYHAVMNTILGPVYLELVTGTSEHAAGPHYQVYMVSSPLHSPYKLVYVMTSRL